MRMVTVDGYPNYDKSAFSEIGPIASSDEAILGIANEQFKLSEFLDKKNFKSYLELKLKLDSVLSSEYLGMSASEISEQEDRPVGFAPAATAKLAPVIASKPAKVDDDDDVMSYFQSIADAD